MSIENATILALVEDLFFISRIGSTVKNLGYQIEWLERAAQVEGTFTEALAARQPALVIVDLNNRHIPWEEWMTAAKQDPETRQIPMMAFGSHMDVDLMKRAKETGADAVYAKSRFTEAMPELIQKLINAAEG